ncbi:hypothetical protein G7Y89_g6524 [Cudoniella acicularis]|uniref:Early meiotic induction protein 1 n=1 Tax=Cudoniella acicularis TaxID=354080 RepID=A0A8H4RKA2_9HELO|nr:hypothetical protein G7Y89_g6524 [Cudoniella acicularis]
MGWLWSDAAASSSSSSSSSAPPPATQENNFSSTVPTSDTPVASKPLSRDELAEQELNAFLQEINAEAKVSSKKYTRMSKIAPPPTSPATDRQNAAQNIPLSEQLLPTSMSCRVAFDEAFYCNSAGGKFNDLYRYGGLRSCSDSWSKFWFCMRTRSYGDKEKEEAIKEHYRTTERRKYPRDVKGAGSEDIWKSRDQKVEWGQAFNVPHPEFDGTDEEWNEQERARRRTVNGTIS